MPQNTGPASVSDIEDKYKSKIEQTEALQKTDIGILQGMNKLAVDTEKIGEGVITELVRQSEVLDVVEQDLYIIREDIKTSR